MNLSSRIKLLEEEISFNRKQLDRNLDFNNIISNKCSSFNNQTVLENKQNIDNKIIEMR
jgi:hypothetical protein